jgi:putative transposase
VNKVETEAGLNSLRRSVKRGLPFGIENWTRSSAVRLVLETTTRPEGEKGVSDGLEIGQ